jgi:hypothetical protein
VKPAGAAIASYATARYQRLKSSLRRRWKTMAATIVAVLVGLAFLGLGLWILLLRVEGFVDYLSPGSLTIGQVSVDGKDTKEHAQLLRARFDHYFRRRATLPSETGFLDVVTLNAPEELFRLRELANTADKIKVEVSGVDVGVILGFLYDLARPPEWVVEADFQNRPDRGVLALRLRRGTQVIRTWYLERAKPQGMDQTALIERLTDDAIFQLVFDFWTARKEDTELFKWRGVIQPPTTDERPPVVFPTPVAVAAYYGALGALGRYYAAGGWSDLEAAVEALRTLRIQMPEFATGLQLLGIALAEKRQEGEAVHVFEQLERLLEKAPGQGADHRRLHVALLKATAKARQGTWQSAHDAIQDLDALDDALARVAAVAGRSAGDRALDEELGGHSAVQRAFVYALYLEFLRYVTLSEAFAAGTTAPEGLRLKPEEAKALAPGSANARPTVLEKVKEIAKRHRDAIGRATRAQAALEEGNDQRWQQVGFDWKRRKSELDARLHLAAGMGFYLMAEWERGPADPDDKGVFSGPPGGRPDAERGTSLALLEQAKAELRRADAGHPNHYLVLQYLGLAYSEPRDPRSDLSVAEQYFDRANAANPSDYAGHELMSSILFRRVTLRGIDWGAKETIAEGLAEAQKAIRLRETSFIAHLRRAQFQAMRLVLERSAEERRKLWAELEQYCGQAERFMPRAFEHAAPELAWVKVASAIQRSHEESEGMVSAKGASPDAGAAQRLAESAQEVDSALKGVLKQAKWYEDRWVPNQRRFEVQAVAARAMALEKDVSRHPSPAEWLRIPVVFPYTNPAPPALVGGP